MDPSVLRDLLRRADESGDLTRDDFLLLLGLEAPEHVRALLNVADVVREREVGSDVHIRGLVEFSNYCRKNCAYCGVRRDNRDVERYRLEPNEIVSLALALDSRGVRTVVLQSGEDAYFTSDILADVIRRIKTGTDMAVTLSVGERPREDYEKWREAGADRYLLRHETVNPDLYAAMHTGSTLETRLRCLSDLRDLGYQTGIGFMVGLPGQTLEDLADDLVFVRDFQPDMLGIGPFIPHHATPLGGCQGGTLEMALKCVALGRIVTRNALIPATTAAGTVDMHGREKALQAGANVVMPNYTPDGLREKYEIYPNKRCLTEDPAGFQSGLRERILAIGRTIATGRGDSPKQRERTDPPAQLSTAN